MVSKDEINDFICGLNSIDRKIYADYFKGNNTLNEDQRIKLFSDLLHNISKDINKGIIKPKNIRKCTKCNDPKWTWMTPITRRQMEDAVLYFIDSTQLCDRCLNVFIQDVKEFVTKWEKNK